MRRSFPAILSFLLAILFAGNAFAQRPLVSQKQKDALNKLSAQLKASAQAEKLKALELAKSKNWTIKTHKSDGGIIALHGVDQRGFPVFLRTHNTEAASATRTNTLQPGGSSGLNLSGTGAAVQSKLAIWDEGTVYIQHNEFEGKTITVPDGQARAANHATHTAGTMIALGQRADVKGMAFNLGTLESHDWDDDIPEMGQRAASLLLSNHSYGDVAGWDGNTWYGLPGDTVDYLFGFYEGRAQAMDRVAFNAPYYLIVESTGNSHSDGINSPMVGDTYFGYQSKNDPTIVEKGPRPAGISSNTGYDVIPTTGNAKNILTVGSVGRVNGAATRENIRVSSFGAWGPTDDGRVKPDIMGMGQSVISTVINNSYSIMSGTSMSAPNVTGSLILLQEYYARLHHDSLMKAATLKGLACHTATDAGRVGPDYIYGWGLLDMQKAAQAITNNGNTSLIDEQNLLQGQTQQYKVVATGGEPLAVAISWTDPEGTISPKGVINDRTPKLVNDIDLRITAEDGTTYRPWVLDPNNPAAPATTGDNIRDNIEQVYVPNTIAGTTYTVTITHKGALRNGGQDFSLIVTGGSPDGSSVTNEPKELSSFPTPAAGKITVLLKVQEAGALKLSLVNIAGQTVLTSNRNVQAGNFSTEINTSALPNGIYVLKLVTGKQVYTKKVIVAR